MDKLFNHTAQRSCLQIQDPTGIENDISIRPVQTSRGASTGPINRAKPDSRPQGSKSSPENKHIHETNDTKRPEPEVRFSGETIGDKVKRFYSLYGPLFMICHIGVSLMSVGFFYTVVYFSVDPVKYIPEIMMSSLGEKMQSAAGESSKIVLAYALHKLILPLRLGGSVYLTQKLSTKVKFPWLNKSMKK